MVGLDGEGSAGSKTMRLHRTLLLLVPTLLRLVAPHEGEVCGVEEPAAQRAETPAHPQTARGVQRGKSASTQAGIRLCGSEDQTPHLADELTDTPTFGAVAFGQMHGHGGTS
jgi:hypothetical protein